MLIPASLDHLDADARQWMQDLLARLQAQEVRLQDQGVRLNQQETLLADKDQELHWRQSKIDKLTHELAVLKRHKFGARSEQYSGEQAELFEEALDSDLAALESEIEPIASARPGRFEFTLRIAVDINNESNTTGKAGGLRL